MIERFKNIFEGLDRAHGVTLVGESNGDGNKIKGKSFVKREPVTDDLWQKHLDGKDSLGVIPINDDNKCKWGCIDIDSYAGFDLKKLILTEKYHMTDVIGVAALSKNFEGNFKGKLNKVMIHFHANGEDMGSTFDHLKSINKEFNIEGYPSDNFIEKVI